MNKISTLPKVFIHRPIPPAGLAELQKHCQVTIHEGQDKPSREDFLKNIAGVDGMLIHPMITIDKEVLDTAGPQLKVISTFSVGLNHIDLELCKERGIKVGYTPGVLSTAVAEHTIGLVLATIRRYEEAFHAVREGVWGTRWDSCLWMAGRQISGSTVGMVGLGRIGLAIAKRVKAFDVAKIYYTSRNQNPESADQIGAEYLSFNELLEKSDFVIAACSVHAGNQGLFNSAAFSKMKKGSVFINITRGILVDQDALLEALAPKGQIAAAGLDVTNPEPLKPSHPLLSLPNVVVTPHIGSATVEARGAMCDLAVGNLLAGLTGKPLLESAYD